MSSKKLREFVAQVKTGGMATGSHYFVELNLPECLVGFNDFKEKLALFCERTEIPGINLDTNPIRTYGEVRQSVYDKVYDQTTMSFYVDNDFTVKRLFDTWVDKIYNPTTKHLSYPDTYTTNEIRIFIQDKEDKNRYVVTLHQAYVKTVSAMPLSYDSKDVLRLNVTLVYKYASYMSYGYSKSSSGNIITSINSAVQNVLQNGITGAISGAISGASNFDYGFSSFAIPQDYFTSFTNFQNNFSLKSTNIGELSRPNDLDGTEFI
jgi:hypothetical protein